MRKSRTCSRVIRVLFLASSVAAFSAGIALATLCANYGNARGYTRYEGYVPGFDVDDQGNYFPVCALERDKVCYECAAWDKPTKEWLYCSENAEGTWGNCDGFVDWYEIPWFDPYAI